LTLPVTPRPVHKKPWIGPPAPPDTACHCGQPARFECQGCKATFCLGHWWKHGHPPIPGPAGAWLKGGDRV
jgi:hypothetical protein